MLIALAVLLGCASLYLNRDVFASETIQISHRSRPPRAGIVGRKHGNREDNPEINPITFILNRSTKLSSLKVFVLSDIETNKYPHAIWNLVSDSNSVPVKDFVYGVSIGGMHPEVKGTLPDPLQPGEKYRLVIESGSRKAEHDFETVARTR